jgi:1,2-diacylglycerol 3-alpha-glucosyltransferase
MRIAIFTDTFLPKIDGIVTFVLSLAKGLADRGHEIYIIAPKYPNFKELVYKNIQVIRLPSTNLFIYPEFKLTHLFSLKVFNLLRKKKIDAILFETPISLGFQAFLVSKLLRKPLIGTFHTFFSHEEYLKHVKLSNNFFQRFFWGYARLFYNRGEVITIPSSAIKKELIKHGLKEPIIPISNGIDLNKFDNSEVHKIKKKYNLKGKTLLFIGRIAHEKNLRYLLECFSEIIKNVPKTKLIIVGDGPQMPELREDIKSLGLKDKVILTGKMHHHELVKSSIFKACDIFVTTSKTETQGISTLEAQANGLVCVGIDEGGVKDLIRSGYNGYLIKDKDQKAYVSAVTKLLTNDKLYKRMRTNTLKEIKKHDLKITLSHWEKLIHKLKSKR